MNRGQWRGSGHPGARRLHVGAGQVVLDVGQHHQAEEGDALHHNARVVENSHASWFIPTEQVKQECAQRGISYRDLRAVVSLATGGKVQAKSKGIGLA